jgi:lipopolysaccharide heptosyltransferase II
MIPDGWHDVRNVLVIRLDNIGDVIMIGPTLRALKHVLPHTRITLLASPAGSQVVPLLPWVDDVLTHRATWQDASGAMPLDPGREQALVDELRTRRFDAAVILTSFAQSPYPPAWVCYAAGIPIRLGQSKEFGGSLLSQRVIPPPDGIHQVDRNLHLLAAAGFAIAGRHLELHPPATAQDEAALLLEGRGIDPDRPFVVMAPGASCAARRYDPDRFGQVARHLAERGGQPVVIVASEREGDLAASVQAAASDGVISLAGQTSLPVLTALLERAGLLVANDSGPMHVADAVGCPMVILFSGTELESQWAPRGAPVRLLRRPTTCAPCYRFRCPYEMECLDIPPLEVVTVALDLLARRGDGPMRRRSNDRVAAL